MKNGATLLFACMLLFSAAVFAENAVFVKYEQDGFFIQRILQVSSESKISITTDTAITLYASEVKLYIKNTGSTARSSIAIVEDLTYLPSGAKIEFMQKPSDIDGRAATWRLDELAPGGEYSVTYRVPIEVKEEAFKMLASPQITAKMVDVSLFVPATAEKGSAIELSLSAGGKPVSGAKIIVSSPTGATMQVLTDAEGKAQFKADDAGFYTYSVVGYNLLNIAATECVVPKIQAPTAGAAIPPKPFDFLGIISGILPYVAGIVLIVAIALMVFNYVQATGESKPAPMPPSQSPSSAYQSAGQNFSYTYSPSAGATKTGPQTSAPAGFSAEDAARKREATRALLDRRKAEMKPEVEDEEAGEEAVEFAPSKSRSEDIEKTIRELEALKAKLKKKKAKGRK
jgi:hypothetical protein